MATCPACGSSRLRNGYHQTPLPLRLLGMRALLCDHCNLQFMAFTLRPPRSRQPRPVPRYADAFAPGQAVDLHKLEQTAPPRTASLPDGVVPATPVVREKAAPNNEAAAGNELRERVAASAPANPVEAPKADTSASPRTSGSGKRRSRNHSSSQRPCPQCAATDTYRRQRRLWERLAFAFTDIRAYQCGGCGHSFYARRRPRG